MGRIVVTEFVSLDGVAEAPGGEAFRYPNWSFAVDRGEDGERFKVDEALDSAALLLGRRTYEGFASAWPSLEGELADTYNGMPKYVVSSSLTDPAWNNTTVLRGAMDAEVRELKDRTTGEICVPGSLQLVQGLLEHDLVDEIRLMTVPVLLGTGRRLFGRTTRMTAWTFVGCAAYGDGVTVTTYTRAAPA